MAVTETIALTKANSASASSLATASYTPANIGDLVVICGRVQGNEATVTGITGGGVNQWFNAIDFADSTNVTYIYIWYGVVTGSAGVATTATVSFSATANVTVDVLSFTAGLGPRTNWVVDVSDLVAYQANAGTTANWPSLTPDTPGLYFGYERSSVVGSPVVPTNAPFTYETDTFDSNVVVWYGGCVASTAYQPFGNCAVGSNVNMIAVVFSPLASFDPDASGGTASADGGEPILVMEVDYTPGLGSAQGVTATAQAQSSLPTAGAGHVSVTVHGFPERTGGGGGGPTPATFPSILSTSGRTIVDENGFAVAGPNNIMKGFDSNATAKTAAEWAFLAGAGAGFVRHDVSWKSLQPTGPPSGPLDFSGISGSYVTSFVDGDIANARAAGLYSWINLDFNTADPPPAWAGTGNSMAAYITYGHAVTNYLARRYGDPSDPDGSGKYSKSVIGFGTGEPASNSSTSVDKNTVLETQQTTAIGWVRQYAPTWIWFFSYAYGSGSALCNDPNTGWNAGGAVQNAFNNGNLSGFKNICLDMHFYTKGYIPFGATPKTGYTAAPSHVFDGKNAYGGKAVGPPGYQLQTTDTTYNGFPVVGNTQAQALQHMKGFIATHKDICVTYNVPLVIGEFAWPQSQPNDVTTYKAYIDTIMSACDDAGVSLMAWWAYVPSGTYDLAPNTGPTTLRPIATYWLGHA